MHAFDVLGDPVRRRILELLAEDSRAAGDIVAVIRREFGISQPAVSQHLRVLRENGFARVTPAGTRRLYDLDARAMQEADAWLQRIREFWETRLDALELEVARGRRASAASGQPHGGDDDDDAQQRTDASQ